MSHLTYFAYPGIGERIRKEQHMSQAVRIGDVIEIAGQGGWHPLDSTWPETPSAHIDQAFSNVDFCLKDAGGKGWSQVYKVRCYYLDPACFADVVRNLKMHCPDHEPVFTAIQVAGLAFPEMQIELEAYAHVTEK
ncbi:related to L-PSP endoribonuclease family protein [Ramularia collo-cygni]|uniref:Related to L-PSP endoribonuclease family protein n=1 Tax=Ramularia collo-cygni TaxID=112498 RepID=A0A2D3VD55_9PEZI|nr:related to L-PSP endoribonuclease family protein [Ramularia collo-cygni]CZT25000.1 related to L-PSP endoribonuclease family protein [Ramularia collo-cygni]